MNVDVALNKARKLQMLDNQNIYVIKKYSRCGVGVENIDTSILKSPFQPLEYRIRNLTIG